VNFVIGYSKAFIRLVGVRIGTLVIIHPYPWLTSRLSDSQSTILDEWMDGWIRAATKTLALSPSLSRHYEVAEIVCMMRRTKIQPKERRSLAAFGIQKEWDTIVINRHTFYAICFQEPLRPLVHLLLPGWRTWMDGWMMRRMDGKDDRTDRHLKYYIYRWSSSLRPFVHLLLPGWKTWMDGWRDGSMKRTNGQTDT